MEAENFVVVAKVADTFGTEGALKLIPIAEKEFLKSLTHVFFKHVGGRYVEFPVEEIHSIGRYLLLKLEGIGDIEEASKFVGAKVFLPAEELPDVGENEFYYYELIGMRVYDQEGNYLGRVKSIQDVGAYSLLLLEDGKTYIPLVDEWVKEISREKGEIRVKPLPPL